MISGPRATGADFEDLTDHLQKAEHQWKPMLFQYWCFPKLEKAMKTIDFFNDVAPQSLKTQWKPVLFEYFCFPELEQNNEKQCFFDIMAPQSFKNQRKPLLFQPRAPATPSKSFKQQWKPVFFNTFASQTNKYTFYVPGPRKDKIFWRRTSKSNMFYSWTTKNQYFPPKDYQKAILSVSWSPRSKIFGPWITEQQCFLSHDRQKATFSVPGH